MKDLQHSPKLPRESMPEKRTAQNSGSLADSPQVC